LKPFGFGGASFITVAVSDCGTITTTSRPLTWPACRNSAQRSSDAVWPFASGDADCALTRDLIGAGRQRFAVGFHLFWNSEGSKRHFAGRNGR
jgi:hypothetical protein